ncbi:MAG: zf-HC2 domain-containing protein [bacterium]
MIRRLIAHHRYMREHRWTHAHLSDYIDEGLDSGHTARVQDHVGICPDCHRVLATLRRTLEGLRALRTEPSPGVAGGVIERLRKAP